MRRLLDGTLFAFYDQQCCFRQIDLDNKVQSLEFYG